MTLGQNLIWNGNSISLDVFTREIATFGGVSLALWEWELSGRTNRQTDRETDGQTLVVVIELSEHLHFSTNYIPIPQGFSKKLFELDRSRNKKVTGPNLWVSGRSNRQTDGETDGQTEFWISIYISMFSKFEWKIKILTCCGFTIFLLISIF